MTPKNCQNDQIKNLWHKNYYLIHIPIYLRDQKQKKVEIKLIPKNMPVSVDLTGAK